MLSILNNILPEYGLGLESRISEITDGWDYIAFVIECEVHYGFELKDLEAMFFERQDFSFGELHEFMTFLKTGVDSPFVHATIAENISELKEIRSLYEDYIIDKRDSFLSGILGE